MIGTQKQRVLVGYQEDDVPTYVYACTACDHGFEAQQAFTDDALTVCPECGGKLRKVFNSVGIVFKGSGFYRNDSRDAKTSSSSSGGSSSSSESSTSTSTEKSSEKSGSTEKKSTETKSSSSSSTASATSSGSSAA